MMRIAKNILKSNRENYHTVTTASTARNAAKDFPKLCTKGISINVNLVTFYSLNCIAVDRLLHYKNSTQTARDSLKDNNDKSDRLQTGLILFFYGA